jgi:hypothetical protein
MNLLVFIAIAWAGAEPTDITLRGLTAHPVENNGKLVRTSGRVFIEFERFELCAESNCIWLEYGSGPKTQPTTWCCGDLTPRDPLKLIQDSQFRRFDRSLRSQESLSATMTGRFDACESGPCFGHMGMSSKARLVIQSVQRFTLIHVH